MVMDFFRRYLTPIIEGVDGIGESLLPQRTFEPLYTFAGTNVLMSFGKQNLFTETFAQARQQGLHLVAHAGEAVGAESIWGAVNTLKPERIGHGIRCLDDPNLVEVLRQQQIPLEVSPQSNYCLGIVERGTPHPIRKMVDARLYCTVNSDDPAMFSTSLTNEYLTLAAQGFSWEELWQLNLNALEATFLDEVEKDKYRAEWHQFMRSLAD